MADNTGLLDFHIADAVFKPSMDEEYILPPLLRLPTELRLRIYELAYSATVIGPKLTWNGGFTLRLYGSQDYRGQVITTTGSPFTLLRVCRQFHDEISEMLPSIQEILFEFNEFSEGDMKRWLRLMMPKEISQVRKLKIIGEGPCLIPNRGARSYTPCDRILLLDLELFERNFNQASWRSIVSRGQEHSYRNRDFYKGFYMMRTLQGCVVIPKAYSHPLGYPGQCNNVPQQQFAVSGFVMDDGKIEVTREAILRLLDAVMTVPEGTNGRRL